MSSPALTIRASARRGEELAWVCDVLFRRFLGLPARIEPHDEPWIGVSAGDGGELRWADHFFAAADAAWLQPDSLPSAAPQVNCPIDDAVLRERIGEPTLVSWFGDGRQQFADGVLHLPIDITGSAFFLLSRYEEAVAGAPADRHGRFPGRESATHRAGVALRPLVDEWVELLWWGLQRVAPGLKRVRRSPRVWVTCDVDAPYSPGVRSLPLALRQTASDLVNHRSPRQAARTLLNAAASRVGVTRFDPFDTFEWMLDQNERAGQKMSFYFLSVRRPRRIDGHYELEEPRVAALIRSIVQRGHEVGLHGSYYSIDEPQRLAYELDGLKRAVARAGGQQARFGNRQHYLRWRMHDTARTLDALGLDHDSTLGWPDIAGFRCGTCHAYPLFDLVRRQPLAILERPLVLMESTVISPTYLALGLGDAAVALMTDLRERCRRFGGEFALLWHNSHFTEPSSREIYRALIQPL